MKHKLSTKIPCSTHTQTHTHTQAISHSRKHTKNTQRGAFSTAIGSAEGGNRLGQLFFARTGTHSLGEIAEQKIARNLRIRFVRDKDNMMWYGVVQTCLKQHNKNGDNNSVFHAMFAACGSLRLFRPQDSDFNYSLRHSRVCLLHTPF